MRWYLMVGLLAIAGCTTVGNTSIQTATEASLSEKITKGSTTKEQVRLALGDPTFSSFSDSGKEQWMYQFATSTPKISNFVPYLGIIDSGSTGKNKSLMILFDSKGVVLNWTLNNSDVDVSSGLAPGAFSPKPTQ